VVLGATFAACYEAEHLSTTEQKAVVYMPGTTYSFGGVAVGTTVMTSPDPYFTIRAQSPTDSDTVQSIVLVQPGCGSDFVLDLSAPLPAQVYCSTLSTGSGSAAFSGSGSGVTCTYIDYTFGAHFHPSQVGSQSCEVDVTTSNLITGSAVEQLYLTGTGLAPAFGMSAQPPMIDFGDVPLNTLTGSQNFTLANTGGGTIHPTGTNSDPTHFVIVPSVAGPLTLGSNGFAPFKVQCQTGSNGSDYSAVVLFTTGSAEGNLQQTVALACNALATSVSASPSPANLGSHLIGDGGKLQNITITNNSSSTTVMVNNFRFTNTPPGEVSFPGAPGAFVLGGSTNSALVSVQYVPTTERDFGPLGSMMFDVDGVSQSVALTGGAHMGSIGTDPATLDFGAVCAGSNQSLDLTVFANAGGDVQLSSPSMVAPPFSASLSVMTPFSLMAHHGNYATVTTMVAPSMSTTPGDATAMLQLATNIPQQMNVPISMHALVLAGGVSPNPSIVHFGPNDLGKATPAQKVTLTNCGSNDLTLTDASFTGSNGAEFQIVSPPDVHVTIPKTMSQDFLVVMNPQTAGPKTAELVFSFTGGPQMVALDGTGYSGPGSNGSDVTTKDRETYYACAVGSPGGLVPLAAVGLLLRRRRRR
jgi:MYXO-CTERM domain-containing protein